MSTVLREPPPGFRWAPRATFYAPPRSTDPRARRITVAGTRCHGCDFAKGEHGPNGECPERIEGAGSEAR